jgi:hypothetical protein
LSPRKAAILTLALALLGLAAYVAYAAVRHTAEPVPDVLRAHQFLLVDNSGHTRLDWSVSAREGGAGISLFDRHGAARVLFYLDPDLQPALKLCDASGGGRVQLTTRPHGGTSFELSYTRDKKAISLYAAPVTSKASTGLVVFDRAGRPRCAAWVDPHSKAVLSANYLHNKPVALIGGLDETTGFNLADGTNSRWRVRTSDFPQ